MGLDPASNPPDCIVTLVVTQDIFNQNELQPLGLSSSASSWNCFILFGLCRLRRGPRTKGYSRRGKKSVTRLMDGSIADWLNLTINRELGWDYRAFCFVLLSSLSILYIPSFLTVRNLFLHFLFFLKRTRKVKGPERNTNNNFRRLSDASFWILVLI